MFYVLRKRVQRALFDQKISSILRTPPIMQNPGRVTILSQTCHDDISIYLLAIKSFYQKLRQGSIVIIDDGTLTDEDKALLSYHLGNPKIVALQSIDVERLISGGTWERLAYAVDLCASSYVVQLDSDVVAVADLPEVDEAVEQNRSFILGTWNGQRIVGAREASAYAATFAPDAYRHIQSESERGLTLLNGAERLHYVRGSSGFYGFAAGSVERSSLEAFCAEMLQIVGDRFREWGSEQFSANYLIANTENAMVLPYPKYAVFGPELDVRLPHFFHFIGAYRFWRGEYGRQARRSIRSLQTSQ